MKNILTYVLVGFIVMSYQKIHAQEISQATWNLKYQFVKKFKEGGYIFSFVKEIDKDDSLSFYGYFDSYKIYDKTGTQVIYQSSDSNSVKKNGSAYISAGKVKFNFSHNTVYTHLKLNNSDYIGVVQADSMSIGTGFFSGIEKLDVQKNLYKGVASIKFGGPVNMIARISETKALIAGDFFNAKDTAKIASKYLGLGVWDITNNTLAKVPYASDPTRVGFGGYYLDHSISKIDGTIGLMSSWTIKIVPPNTDPSKTLSDPILPPFFYSHFVSCLVINKDRIYAVIQADSIGNASYLVKLKPDYTWQTLARITNPNAVITTDNWVSNMVYDEKTGDSYISGNFTHINGKPVSNVVRWNDQTGIFSNLPTPPFISGYYKMERSRVDVVDGEIFLIEDDGNLLLSQIGQRIYVLKDIIPPSVPSFTSSSLQMADTTVNLSGITDPNVWLDFFLRKLGSNTITTKSTRSDNTGKWFVSFGNLSEGSYEVYSQSRDQFGNASAKSFISFKREKAVEVITSILLDQIDKEVRMFPNPARDYVDLTGVKSINKISGSNGNYFPPISSRKNGEITIDLTSLSSGFYILECEKVGGGIQMMKLVVLR